MEFKAVYWLDQKPVSISKFKSSSIEKMKPGRKYFAIQTKNISYSEVEERIENRNPFIFLPSYCFQTTDKLYFLWPFSTGGRLHKIIDKVGILKQELCTFYVAQLILALESLHKHGWVYRGLTL